MVTNEARRTRDIKYRIATEKAALNIKKSLSISKFYLNKEEISEMLHLELKFGHFRNQIRITWKVLKCGAEEG